ncbi:phosphatidylinositol glycan [Cavenderia fasciculata]|uniref:Phosphatidylinositol glycan n=1 Tax=Cavenderia fasciculata TaxID=261658 RepID=F4Q1E7_CACFS|nr:phosphatidylinositol glycan [Cavenderia fasciculata]EGG18648.1 phosphatidylinositol glycan [Cavenderia fasciculata]|eukprot:XP_004366552.1 phosphatidylinositol glycan [Cavenderia fasciculata]
MKENNNNNNSKDEQDDDNQQQQQQQSICSTSQFNLTYYLVYLMLMIGIGGYLFFSGFLLMRFELPIKSQCRVVPTVESHLPLLSSPTESSSTSDDFGCWTKPTFKKAVIVVIDALRFDFLARQSPDSPDYSTYFHNRLPSLTSILEQQPNNTLLYRFIADSPTVTMQRIKGITTGSLPTFIDVGSNFGGDAIVEDNLINQLAFNDNNNNNNNNNIADNNNNKKNSDANITREEKDIRKKVIFIGDDTWVSLFPNHFYAQYPYPSFNVKDLHTVDNGVIENLLPTITQMKSDNWQVVIGHLLGVDHVGHLHGPYHPEMIKKLSQMDQFLLSIINNIDNETLFILMGDHGMTTEGNHGGSSKDETEAGLFMYSKKITLNQTAASSSSSTDQIEKWNQFEYNDRKDIRTISQIDLVSTLSLLLGVPIPYANLGTIIPEPFIHHSINDNGGWKKLIDAQRLNSWQIHRYVDSYSKISKDFTKDKLSLFSRLLEETEKGYAKLFETNQPKDDQFYKVYSGYRRLQSQIVEYCREMWATFDTESMVWGEAVLISTGLVIMAIIYTSIMSPTTPLILLPIKTIILMSVVGVISSPVTYLMFSSTNESLLPIMLGVVALFCNFGVLTKLVQSHLHMTYSYSFFSLASTISILAAIVCGSIGMLSMILHGASLASNSFIESQQKVVNYFLMTFCYLAIILLLAVKKNEFSRHDLFNSLGLIVTLHLTSPSFLSHQLGDIIKFKRDPTTSIDWHQFVNHSTQWVWCVPILYYLFKILISKLLQEPNSKKKNRSSSSSYFSFNINIKKDGILELGAGLYTRILTGLCMICTMVYWCFQNTQDAIVKSLFPCLVYIISIVGVIRSLRPLSYTPPHSSVKDDEKVFRQQLKKLLFKLVEFIVYFFMVALLLLGPSTLSTLLWSIIQIYFIIHILNNSISSNNNNSSSNNNNVIFSLVHWIVSIGLYSFLALNHFFSTGHDYSFNKIQFETAYIGFEEHVYWRGALLVLLNTFSSPILFSLLLPIFIIFIKFNFDKTDNNKLDNSNSNNSDSENELILDRDGIEMQEKENNIKYSSSSSSSFSQKKRWKTNNDIIIGYMFYLLFFLYNSVVICFTVYGLRRHLMVWRVFAPKYIFETVQLLMVLVSLILSSVILNYHRSILHLHVNQELTPKKLN